MKVMNIEVMNMKDILISNMMVTIMENNVKNHADALIFHTAICAEVSQMSFDATSEIA